MGNGLTETEFEYDWNITAGGVMYPKSEIP
jgi:hypothetical protein